MAVTSTTTSTLVAMILVLLFLISHKSVLAAAQSTCSHRPLVCVFEQAKLRISQLESVLDNRMHDLNLKSEHLGERTKLLEEIDHLHSVLLILKDDPSHAEKRLALLEEELRTLWDVSRRNNFDLHTLELKAQDAEKRLDVVASRAQKVRFGADVPPLPVVVEAVYGPESRSAAQLHERIESFEQENISAQQLGSYIRVKFLTNQAVQKELKRQERQRRQRQ